MNTAIPSVGPVARVRRRLVGESPVTEVHVGGDWVAWDDVTSDPLGVPAGVAQRVPSPLGFAVAAGHGEALLPFAPASFRDFMLYEAHVIAASRGIARKYLPGPYRLAAAYEKLTRSTFPMFKPNALWFQQPIYYMSNAMTFVPTETTVAPPTYADSLDYELELGFVLRRPLRDATPEEALQAIGGYVALNDFSARNVQLKEMRSGFGPQKAKHFLSSMSSDLVAAGSVDPAALNASVSINGSLVTASSTRNPAYTIGEALAFASRDEQLYPGELFGTGTLPGCSGIESGHELRPGDHLELTIEGIGTIRHTIAKEPA